jgi:hypothetical protein
MSLLNDLNRYHGAGKPNPVRLHTPTHVPLHVPGVGQLVPIPNPTGWPEDTTPYGQNVTEWRWWGGPRELTVGASIDTSEHGPLLHVSASQPKHWPTWETMGALRSFFFPDTVDVAMLMPRRADYINLSTTCFHLWQVPVEWGLH